MKEFKLPDIGEGVHEGEIVRWLVNEGDPIKEEQLMVEVMTDKATVQIPCPWNGRVSKLLAKAGEVVKTGAGLILIEEAGAPTAAVSPPAALPPREEHIPVTPVSAVVETVVAPEGVLAAPAVRKMARDLGVDLVKVKPTGAFGRITEEDVKNAARPAASPTPSMPIEKPAAPIERPSAPIERPAAPVERPPVIPITPPTPAAPVVEVPHVPQTPPASPAPTVAPATHAAPAPHAPQAPHVSSTAPVPQSPPRSEAPAPAIQRAPEPAPARVLVKAPPPAPAQVAARPMTELITPAAHPSKGGLEERIPVAGLRKRILEKMGASKRNAAHFTYVEEVDMSALVHLKAKSADVATKRGVKLTYLPFIVKACVAALEQHPTLNSTLDEAANEIVVKKYYNIGLAVATEEGLTVAVIHDADKKDLWTIAQEIERLAAAARERTIKLEELTGGTFTITSLGVAGGMFATPIINHPEVAIVGIHKIEKRPVVRDEAVVVRDMMYLSCSFDHRVIDGHVGAAFVQTLKDFLEHPALLLLGA